jgi:hypothetical protein
MDNVFPGTEYLNKISIFFNGNDDKTILTSRYRQPEILRMKANIIIS